VSIRDVGTEVGGLSIDVVDVAQRLAVPAT
jgi:hypothetical protein